VKKIFIVICLLFSPIVAHAEDVYCGDYNGKPAYVDIDSIEKDSHRTGVWEITNYGIYPQFSDSYSANINADGLWYKVNFSIQRQASYSVWILDKNKKNLHTPINTIKFDFAFQTVQEYYPEANRRSEAIAKKKLEEADIKAIENAKIHNNALEEGINLDDPKYKTGYVTLPYKYQTKLELNASLTNAIMKYTMAYNIAPAPKNITPELRSLALEVKSICEFFTKEELIKYAGSDIEMQKALLSFK